MDWSFVEWLMSLNCRELIGEKTIKYSMIIIYVWGWRMRKDDCRGVFETQFTLGSHRLTSSLQWHPHSSIYTTTLLHTTFVILQGRLQCLVQSMSILVQYQCPIVYVSQPGSHRPSSICLCSSSHPPLVPTADPLSGSWRLRDSMLSIRTVPGDSLTSVSGRCRSTPVYECSMKNVWMNPPNH